MFISLPNNKVIQMPTKDKKRLIIPVISVALFILLSLSVSAESFIREILSPFEGLNIPDLYRDYACFIDFVIYFIVFVGIAKVVLAKRFEGRGGTLVIVGTGLILSLSLAVTEARMGFSLESFGPVAAFIFIILVGVILFRFIQHAGLGVAGSACVAYIILHFSIMAITPSIFDWIQERAPFIHGVLMLALIAAVWKGFRLITRGHTTTRAIGSMVRAMSAPTREREEVLPEKDLEREENIVRHRLQKITKWETKDSKRILDDLNEIRRAIIKYGDTPKGRAIIAEKLRDISPREHLMIQKLNYLSALSEKIERIDIKQLRELEQKIHRLKGKNQEIARKELKLERAKIRCLEHMRKFEFRAKRYDQNFKYCLSQAINYLRRDNSSDAEHWINEAIKYEEEAEHLFKKIRRWERMVVFLTKKEIKKEK